MPKISIIVPIYNVEKYLDRCMQSLLNQTFKDIEIIMVDDGSPDHCPQMCDEYARQDSRIKVIHKKNGGLGYARNSGLSVATGEYVAFVDSDDYVDVSMYEDLYKSAVAEHADAAFCGFFVERRKNEWMESNEVLVDTVWKGEDVRSFMLDMIASKPYEKVERKYQMSVWHSIYKKSIIVEAKIEFVSEREVVSEDIPFQIDFLKKAKIVVYLKNHYYHYCLNKISLTNKFKKEKYTGFKNLRTLLLLRLKDNVSIQRIDRLFIGYCRAFIYDLISSDRKDKREILQSVVNDFIWKDLKSSYAVKWLPLYSRIYYSFILHRQICLIFFYTYIIEAIKKLR